MAVWEPQYLNFKVKNTSKQAIDADYWNALWNTLIAQADNNTAGVQEIFETYVSGVKGDAEFDYRHGDVNITKAHIGLSKVDNTADIEKYVAHAIEADHAGTASSASHADNATSALHATSADSATNASHAINADVALNAGGVTTEGFTTLFSSIIRQLNTDYDFENAIRSGGSGGGEGGGGGGSLSYLVITSAQIDALFE